LKKGPAEAPDVMMDQQLKKLMKELGEAINDSRPDSDEIAEVISRIKAGGYDVFVALEATVGYSQREQEVVEKTLVNTQRTSASFQMTSQDLKFLRSMRIAVDQDK
jgi:hypothetical protein